MDLKRILLCGLVLAAASFAAHAASPMVEINMCYQKAGDDAVKIGACLEQESKLVQAEYKDAVERVTVVAKAWDKPNRNRTRWDKLMRANQAFDNFIKRECDFVKNTTREAVRRRTMRRLPAGSISTACAPTCLKTAT